MPALPVHARTGLRAVGLRRDGRPIWPVLGGSDDGGPPAPAATDPGAPAPTAPPAPPTAPPTLAPVGPTAEQLADAQRQATEATEQRDQLQSALDAIQRAINPDAGPAATDPVQLAAAVADRDRQLAEQGEQLRAARVELAAHQGAADAGARPDRLLNSRAFAAALAKLDPDGDQFADQLRAAITAAVDADPDLYRATLVRPARSGGEFRGSPQTTPQPATLADAIAAQFSG
ncbi:hypothetical protein ACFYST_08195 [Kitasatospora sp. NPDC004614]|uniref:hypothetical protein n=1 Tax=unclassified Kitasatospora TaxID=2633591 RepID=UPI0036C1E0E3